MFTATTARALSFFACAIAGANAAIIDPAPKPGFKIDYDLPAGKRFAEVYEYFKEPLSSMVDYFYETISPEYQQWFIDNEAGLKKSQPDVYAEMANMAEIVGQPLIKTLTVNSITEFSTFCTSIVAKTPDNEISHVRNLDFGFTDTMKELVYMAYLIKDGELVAEAPSIAGF